MGTASRIAWIDYAKGICIVLVVMFQATHGVEDRVGQTGWMHELIAFSKPFRMPDFFLVSGLLLSAVIARDWRSYLDSKLIHFAYFYVIWLTLQFAIKAPFMAAEQGWAATAGAYFHSYVSPFASLWFIYVLPIFFVVTKLLRKVHPVWVFAGAAALEMLPAPGIRVLDKCTMYFVYFYGGYVLAPYVFAFARRCCEHRVATLAALAAWAVANGWLVDAGYAPYPVVSIVLGLCGAAAVIAISALLARGNVLGALAYCGRHSLVIYLAYFIPMAATRTVLLKTGWVQNVDLISLVATVAGIAGALVLHQLVRNTRVRFVFERPRAFNVERMLAGLARIGDSMTLQNVKSGAAVGAVAFAAFCMIGPLQHVGAIPETAAGNASKAVLKFARDAVFPPAYAFCGPGTGHG